MRASAGAAGGCAAAGGYFLLAPAAPARIFALFIAAICALFLCACSDMPRAKIGESAPEISARDSAGKLAKLQKSGVEILSFWQNGCAACLKIMPELENFAQEHSIKIWAINSTDSAETIASHERESGFSATKFLRDNSQITAERYEIFAIPTMFIVQDGILREKILGERTIKFLSEKISKYF